MIIAEYSDKPLISTILADAFDDNQSVNYIVRQDANRKKRIKRLMEYSFEVCYRFGRVVLSNDKKACALIVYPDKKKVTIRSIIWNIKLITDSIGFRNIKRAMARESAIKRLQPKETMFYLWFIGVQTSHQGREIGTELLKEIVVESEAENRVICLETSTPKNLSWYQKLGFQIYEELDLGYTLFFLKKEVFK